MDDLMKNFAALAPDNIRDRGHAALSAIKNYLGGVMISCLVGARSHVSLSVAVR